MRAKLSICFVFLFLLSFVLTACGESAKTYPTAVYRTDVFGNVQTQPAPPPTTAAQIVQTTAPAPQAGYAVANPKYYVDENNFLIKPLNGSDPNVVFLSFDDAPDGHALQIANIVKEKGCNCVFFVNGHFLVTDEQKATLKKLHEMGMEIGNHTMTHAHLTQLDYEGQKKEIAGVDRLVESIIGVRPRFFRPPYGEYNKDTIKICEEEGLTLMTWTYGYDWVPEYCNADALAKIMVDNPYVGPGSNLLMHDREWTMNAIARIIDGLRAEGLQPVNVRELAAVKPQ